LSGRDKPAPFDHLRLDGEARPAADPANAALAAVGRRCLAVNPTGSFGTPMGYFASMGGYVDGALGAEVVLGRVRVISGAVMRDYAPAGRDDPRRTSLGFGAQGELSPSASVVGE